MKSFGAAANFGKTSTQFVNRCDGWSGSAPLRFQLETGAGVHWLGGAPLFLKRMSISAVWFLAETVITSLADIIICGETFSVARAAVALEISCLAPCVGFVIGDVSNVNPVGD